MKIDNKTLEFNEQNSLYKILHRYVIENQIQLGLKSEDSISKTSVRKFICSRGLKVNGVNTYSHNLKIGNGDRIKIEDQNIDFICTYKKSIINDDPNITVENKDKILDIVVNKGVHSSDGINEFVSSHLKTNLGCEKIEDLKLVDSKKAFSQILALFQIKGFDEIRNADYSYELTNYLKSKLAILNISKELSINKNQLSTAGKLIDILIEGKVEKENNLLLLIDNLLNGNYDRAIFKFLQDYKKIYLTDTFQYFVNPLLQNNLSSLLAIENLLKAVHKSFSVEGFEPKFNYYEECKPTFVLYFEFLKESDVYNNKFFYPIAEHLFKLLKEQCDTAIEKSAHIKVEPTNRKYNFSNADRIEQEIFLIVSNDGEGLAKSVSISSISNFLHFPEVNVGILKPDEKREISIISKIKFDSNFKPELNIEFSWEEISGKQTKKKSLLTFQIQQSIVPWEELKKKNPYSNSIIENAEKLFGREEVLDELKSNIFSDNIESYKLWGQKRVGKSSIVKTLKTILDEEEKILIVYRSLGGLKNTDPVETLNSLGESLCTEVYEEIDKKIKEPLVRERLRSVTVPQFNGSLYPLETYIKQLKRIDTTLKFVFMLDEFDRINEEFFLPGNLGETLSLSIGKGLNEYNYIGFILVGSENMHLLDRHGINYNSFQEKEVDTFHKQWEYHSFVQIVKGPVAPFINYSDEAIEKIFDASNGNPYFANLICSNIFKNAYKFKDNEVDSHTVNDAISIIINSSQKSHFEHYWSDGITEESNIKKERKADIRRRILVSFSMQSNVEERHYPSEGEIARNFKRPIETEYQIEKYEVENTLTEFINRKIFIENDVNQIRILPNLFESWLCGKGKTLMIEGVSDLEALQREIDLEKELALKSDELNRVSENYHFKEKIISVEKFSNYFKQFGSASKQRRVFKLIDSIYYISKTDILEFYRKEGRTIFPKTEIFLKEKAKTIFRENIELFTFSKYFSENVPIVESFKLINHIRKQKLLKEIKKDSQIWKKNKAEEIIIIQPIIDSFDEIKDELFLLLNEEIRLSPISIRLITFVITTKAKADLIKATSSFANFKLLTLREVEETKIKPFIEGTEIFENSEEANQAFYEVRNQIQNTSKDVLLILFEDYCPSKTCPALWHKSSQFQPIFYNEHGFLEVEESNENILEQRRLRLYHANVEFSQGINKFITEWLKEKAKNQELDGWFHVKLIPKSILSVVHLKSVTDNQKDPIETYFDFSDYKRIIDHNKEMVPFFNDSSEGLTWMEKLNALRRLPSHPEKPVITEKDVDYFEKMMKQILPRLK